MNLLEQYYRDIEIKEAEFQAKLDKVELEQYDNHVLEDYEK